MLNVKQGSCEYQFLWFLVWSDQEWNPVYRFSGRRSIHSTTDRLSTSRNWRFLLKNTRNLWRRPPTSPVLIYSLVPWRLFWKFLTLTTGCASDKLHFPEKFMKTWNLFSLWGNCEHWNDVKCNFFYYFFRRSIHDRNRIHGKRFLRCFLESKHEEIKINFGELITILLNRYLSIRMLFSLMLIMPLLKSTNLRQCKTRYCGFVVE